MVPRSCRRAESGCGVSRMTFSASPEESQYFWARVIRSENNDACWLWTLVCEKAGYGSFMFRGKKTKAHRFAFLVSGGKLQTGDVVRHTCDNPPCCNPNHLLAGSQRDNYWDSFERGRASCGSSSHLAKLIEVDVVNIRLDPRSQTQIANEYGVSQSTISLIKSGKKWKCVPMPLELS